MFCLLFIKTYILKTHQQKQFFKHSPHVAIHTISTVEVGPMKSHMTNGFGSILR